MQAFVSKLLVVIIKRNFITHSLIGFTDIQNIDKVNNIHKSIHIISESQKHIWSFNNRLIIYIRCIKIMALFHRQKLNEVATEIIYFTQSLCILSIGNDIKCTSLEIRCLLLKSDKIGYISFGIILWNYAIGEVGLLDASVETKRIHCIYIGKNGII